MGAHDPRSAQDMSTVHNLCSPDKSKGFLPLKKSDKNDLKRLGHPTFIRLFKIRFHSSIMTDSHSCIEWPGQHLQLLRSFGLSTSKKLCDIAVERGWLWQFRPQVSRVMRTNGRNNESNALFNPESREGIEMFAINWKPSYKSGCVSWILTAMAFTKGPRVALHRGI